jgi:hypothetical protein
MLGILNSLPLGHHHVLAALGYYVWLDIVNVSPARLYLLVVHLGSEVAG